MRRVLTLALAGAAALSFASAANAALIFDPVAGTLQVNGNPGSNTASILFDAEQNGVVVPGVTSTLMLTLTGISGNSYSFNYNLSLTSGTASMVAFGFDTSPAISSVTGVTGPLTFAANANLPGVSNSIDACFYSGNNCGAANNQATSFAGTFTLNFANSNPVVFSTIADRYASIAPNGQSGEGRIIVPPAVPEPATWAMMLVGFGGIGMAMRRGRKRTRTLMQVA